MLLRDLLIEHPADFAIIRHECSQYLQEVSYRHVIRDLPRTYDDVHRVKIRQKRSQDTITQVFNEAFSNIHHMRQRSLITHTQALPCTDTHEPFYVFPVNGYNFMYSKEVSNSTADYKHLIDVVFEQFTQEDDAAAIVADVVKHSYTNHSIVEGIDAGAEIIFYNIPYYYAIRCSKYPIYEQLTPYLYD